MPNDSASSCIPFYPALPLTFDNVFEVVKTVRKWRKLAEKLMDWFDYKGSDRKKLNAIEQQYISDEARLKAVVEAFLQRKHPSWRKLIHALYRANENSQAEMIKTNAEPCQGE